MDGRRVGNANCEAGVELEEAGVIVDMEQVVEDHVEMSAGVARPQPAEGGTELDDSLAFGEDPSQAVGVDIWR